MCQNSHLRGPEHRQVLVGQLMDEVAAEEPLALPGRNVDDTGEDVEREMLLERVQFSAQQRAATPIDAAQAGANGEGLHGHLTQSSRSARLIRPEM